MTEPDAQTHAPLRAFRAWLTAVHAQIEELGHQIDAQIDYHEGEIKRLRAQRERSAGVLESMKVALNVVEEKLPNDQQRSPERERKREGGAAGGRRTPRASSRTAERSDSKAREEESAESESEGEGEGG